jgi:hypothetical protein
LQSVSMLIDSSSGSRDSCSWKESSKWDLGIVSLGAFDSSSLGLVACFLTFLTGDFDLTGLFLLLWPVLEGKSFFDLVGLKPLYAFVELFHPLNGLIAAVEAVASDFLGDVPSPLCEVVCFMEGSLVVDWLGRARTPAIYPFLAAFLLPTIFFVSAGCSLIRS